MTEGIAKESNHHQLQQQQQQLGQQQPVWFCPSRWLLAHQDPAADINTMSSHMCLVDINNDGESLLALIDFKAQLRHQANEPANRSPLPTSGSPYECRMRIYRGQKLVYNHLLEDLPACLIVTGLEEPRRISELPSAGRSQKGSPSSRPAREQQQQQQQQQLLTMPINDDVYFYHKLRASHRLSLEDDDRILGSLNKSEIDAWEMVKQNKVDPETMRELLVSLAQEMGNYELTSHSQNFIALTSYEQRRQYLISWKLKKLTSSSRKTTSTSYGEQLMSMDTICCAAARLRYSSGISRSGDYGQSRDKHNRLAVANLDKSRAEVSDGLVLGTEDRHLLIYRLGASGNHLERHHRLPSTPDHILVERRAPDYPINRAESGGIFNNSEDDYLTYKILISCRNCRIYALNQSYGTRSSSDQFDSEQPRQLIALKSNVLEMSWTGLDEPRAKKGQTAPCFVVACLDRRVYCFGSQSGGCKWIIELELPVTCVTCLPKLEIGQEETSLIGVASQANRVDLYAASTGRIADSIYFDRSEFPLAMTFGRFGREDNCLCLVTNSGRLLVLILKRTAKLAHGQCLSSAASYAASSLAACRQLLRESGSTLTPPPPPPPPTDLPTVVDQTKQPVKLEPKMNLPSGFELSKSNRNATDQMIDSILQSNHSCDQTALKGTLDDQSKGPRLQIPIKGRDFVEQILEQSRESGQTSRVFASHMVKLRNKIKSSLELQAASLNGNSAAGCHNEGNRLMLTQVLGLGNVYRIRMSLRVNLENFIDRYHEQVPLDSRTDRWHLDCHLRPGIDELSRRQCQIRPFRLAVALERDKLAKYLVRPTCEANIEAKLVVLGPLMEPVEGDFVPIEVQIYIHHQNSACAKTLIQRPILLTAININLTTS